MLALAYLIVLPMALLTAAGRAAWLRDSLAEGLFGSGAGIMLLMIFLCSSGLGAGQYETFNWVVLCMLFVAVFLVCDALVIKRHKQI